MVKLKVFKKLGKCVIDIGIQEVEDINFARQLVEKGLAELVDGEIPPKTKREEKKEVKEVEKQVKEIKKEENKTPKFKKKG